MQKNITIYLSIPAEYKEIDANEDTRFRFKCTDECRKNPRCCGNPLLTPEDLSKLARHFNLSNEEFFHEYCKLFYFRAKETEPAWYDVILKRGESGYCILLDTKNPIKSCSVHEDCQPYVCGTFPVLFKKEDKYGITMCPGVDKGDLYTVGQWVKENKTIEYRNRLRRIAKKQMKPFKDDFQRLLKLIKRKEKKKVKKLTHEIKMRQREIIMEMFGIK